MRTRTRYSFIIAGAVFFLVAAPLVVFYVGGIRYNFSDNQYDKTGLLSVETDPKKATVTLDGEHKESSPVDYRFLDPKEYAVNITKDGYFDWSKRLEVKAGKATIASGFLGKIYLLKKPLDPVIVSDKVKDFYLDDSVLLYLSDTSVNLVNADSNKVSKTLPLTQSFANLRPSPQGSFFLLMGKERVMLLDVSAWRLFDVTAMLNKTTNWQVTDNGTVLALRQNILVSIDPVTKQEVPLLQQVKSFGVLDQNLYYTQADGDHAILALTGLATASTATPQVLMNDLPLDKAEGQLMITAQKDIVLFADNNLYKVNQNLDPIAEGVKELYFDAPSGTLLYSTATELSWYEFLANKTHLITRNTQAISSPRLAASIGYAFYLQNNSIQAMELDTTDHQNNYLLQEVVGGTTLKLDKKIKKLYFLDGQTLKSIEIR